MNATKVTDGLRRLLPFQGKLLRAARLVMLQQRSTGVTIDEEVDRMSSAKTISLVSREEVNKVAPEEVAVASSHNKPTSLNDFTYYLDRPNDPFKLAKFVHPFEDIERRRYLRIAVTKARASEDHIKNYLGKMENDEAQDIFLIQQFLVCCLSNVKRQVAYRYFFKEAEHHYDVKNEKFIRYVCIVCLPLYVIAMAFYVFLFGANIGAGATNTWLMGVFISLLQSIFILQPLKIFVLFIVISVVAEEVRWWHGLLRERTRSIMNRSKGLIRNHDSLIQVRDIISYFV